MEETFTTNVSCGYIDSGTTINSTDNCNDIIKSILYFPDPPTEYESKHIGTWTQLSDVDTFFSTYTPYNGWDGLKLGNYVTIQDGTYNVDWEIAGFNMEHNQTAEDGNVYNNGYGICMIPRISLGNNTSWGEGIGGYKRSYLHLHDTDKYQVFYPILGSHLINRNVLLSSAVGSTGPTAYTWTTAYFTAMSPHQVAGYVDKTYNNGEAYYKLPLFDYELYNTSAAYWMRAVIKYADEDTIYASRTRVLRDTGYDAANVYSSGTERPLMYLR